MPPTVPYGRTGDRRTRITRRDGGEEATRAVCMGDSAKFGREVARPSQGNEGRMAMHDCMMTNDDFRQALRRELAFHVHLVEARGRGR